MKEPNGRILKGQFVLEFTERNRVQSLINFGQFGQAAPKSVKSKSKSATVTIPSLLMSVAHGFSEVANRQDPSSIVTKLLKFRAEE
jgi:hypothetical protein